MSYAVVMAIIAVLLVWPAWRRMRREEAHSRELLARAHEEGRHEPVSIRPWVDPAKCMGSGSCVAACPEKEVLRVIDGRAHLVAAALCVGHGACVRACPVGAIELVFGSERRGVDLPEVRPDFQSNVPGMYIIGELGGMGLIANAVEQGAQAVRGMRVPPTPDGGVDVVIVGAGPAGLAAGMAAVERGLSYVLLDQDELGGAIRHYPRQKIVMTRPMRLPGYPPIQLHRASKEELIAIFEDAVATTGLRIDGRERVQGIARSDAFEITTDKRMLRASRVVLAIGRRGTPRRLGVLGEDHEKVAYRLVDPELYDAQHILVVGGGDSALEAACDLADHGNRVTLSYRSEKLGRPKQANLERLRSSSVDVVLSSEVVRIDLDRVALRVGGEVVVLPNDFVFVFAGGVLPTAFLESAGIRSTTHYGRRVVS